MHVLLLPQLATAYIPLKFITVPFFIHSVQKVFFCDFSHQCSFRIFILVFFSSKIYIARVRVDHHLNTENIYKEKVSKENTQ